MIRTVFVTFVNDQWKRLNEASLLDIFLLITITLPVTFVVCFARFVMEMFYRPLKKIIGWLNGY